MSKPASQAVYVWIAGVHRKYKAWPAEFIWLDNFGWLLFWLAKPEIRLAKPQIRLG